MFYLFQSAQNQFLSIDRVGVWSEDRRWQLKAELLSNDFLDVVLRIRHITLHTLWKVDHDAINLFNYLTILT